MEPKEVCPVCRIYDVNTPCDASCSICGLRIHSKCSKPVEVPGNKVSVGRAVCWPLCSAVMTLPRTEIPVGSNDSTPERLIVGDSEPEDEVITFHDEAESDGSDSSVFEVI